MGPVTKIYKLRGKMALLSPQAINSTAIIRKKQINGTQTYIHIQIQALRKTMGAILTGGRLDCYQVLFLDNTLAAKVPLT